jgi:signal transduction histidine kinase/CheY-like chemotaxis protein
VNNTSSNLYSPAGNNITLLGDALRTIAAEDSAAALNASAIENIERMTVDTAGEVAEFLYARDDDILYAAGIEPSEESYRRLIENRTGRLIRSGGWELGPDGGSWVPSGQEGIEEPLSGAEVSTNTENNDMDGFNYRPSAGFEYEDVPLYDEITFVDLDGNELVKVVAEGSPKSSYPMDPGLKDVSARENTYVKAEGYFEELGKLAPGEIYVSDVIGAYVGSNYVGMYTPEAVAKAAADRGYAIGYSPEEQAYAGEENPNGRRFEGIVRWASPVTDSSGAVMGYVTMALNHDHIMEFVDHLTPMNERYTELPSAFEGNYAFIWDYKCRSICHPRHHSIAGFDPETGDPETPWLESSIYDAWQASGVEKWTDFIEGWPTFDQQSRTKKPAPELTKAGLVGLDGRYLNNAPQCTGWMDLTKDGGSGSFYILWSGLYKLTTAAAIPYYTGHYAPSEDNGNSLRGFGFVAIGAGLEDFARPATEMVERLDQAIGENLSDTFLQLIAATAALIVVVVFIAIWIASSLTNSIKRLIRGIARFRSGERQFRFDSKRTDEFGDLADSFDDMAESIVDSVKNPLSIIDMDLRIMYMNEPALAVNGRTLDEVVGTLYGDTSLYPIGSVHCPIRALTEGREADILHVEGRELYIRGSASYLLDKDGGRIGYIIISADVTEMVLRQMQLEQAVGEANRANEHKGEFLARMSHEIRTPMNAIIGITNIVQRRLDEREGRLELGEIKGHVRQIENSSQHLLGLLNDILDISKIEAGKIELSEDSVDILKLADTVAGIIRPRCGEKNIGFTTDFGSFPVQTFIGDSLRLRQVLINLLGNAVKFTPELGRIGFSVANRGSEGGRTLIGFSVTDTGIGISEGALATIFQPFEQESGKISRQYGGTGLGLAISQRIVQLFGGEISVKSSLGEGSEFSFEIWMREAASETPAAAVVAEGVDGVFAGKRALLVDDVDINRIIVVSLLEATGIEIDEAGDGAEAVDMFEKSPEGLYDVILMDVQMPHMDGYEATRAIRAMDRSDARGVPIVALTANAFKEDIDRALGHGMNAHIAKPIEMETLTEVLFRFLR